MLLPILVISYVTAVSFHEDLVGLLSYAYGPMGQLAPPVLAALFWKRATGIAALLGLLLGSAATLGWPHLMPPSDLHPGLPGLAVNAAVILVVSLMTSRRA